MSFLKDLVDQARTVLNLSKDLSRLQANVLEIADDLKVLAEKHNSSAIERVQYRSSNQRAIDSLEHQINDSVTKLEHQFNDSVTKLRHELSDSVTRLEHQFNDSVMKLEHQLKDSVTKLEHSAANLDQKIQNSAKDDLVERVKLRYELLLNFDSKLSEAIASGSIALPPSGPRRFLTQSSTDIQPPENDITKDIDE